MVLVVSIGNMHYYACEHCLYLYRELETAESCELWCKTHNSCNSEILEKSVGRIRRYRRVRLEERSPSRSIK